MYETISLILLYIIIGIITYKMSNTNDMPFEDNPEDFLLEYFGH